VGGREKVCMSMSGSAYEVAIAQANLSMFAFNALCNFTVIKDELAQCLPCRRCDVQSPFSSFARAGTYRGWLLPWLKWRRRRRGNIACLVRRHLEYGLRR